MAQLREMLGAGRAPLVILGGGGWSAQACADMPRFAEAYNLPVALRLPLPGPLRQSRIRTTWATSASASIRSSPSASSEADVLLVIGPRLGEMTTGGYTLLDVPRAASRSWCTSIPAPRSSGRVYQAELLINAGMPRIRGGGSRRSQPVDANRLARRHRARRSADYEAWQTAGRKVPGARGHGRGRAACCASALPRRCDRHQRRRQLRDVGPSLLSATRRIRTQLAPTSGAMGYGVPAAVAAKLVQPERTVVCFAGDGDFMMNGQELATAVQYGAGGHRSSSSTTACTARSACTRSAIIRARVSGTDLGNPDFAALARAYGATARPSRRRLNSRCVRARPESLDRGADRSAHRPGRDHAAHDAFSHSCAGAEEQGEDLIEGCSCFETRRSSQRTAIGHCEEHGDNAISERPDNVRHEIATSLLLLAMTCPF